MSLYVEDEFHLNLDFVKAHSFLQEIKMKVKIKLMNEGTVPVYKTEGSSGADVFANGDVLIKPNEVKLIPLGFAVEIPKGYEMQIRPRSGLSNKHKLLMPNSFGTIDSDYRGEVMAPFINLDSETYEIKKGDRIAQAVIAPVIQVEFEESNELSETARGSGGFGSTGKN